MALISLIAVALYLASFRGVSAVITGRVYRSSQLSAGRLERVIQENGIRTIINLRGKFSSAQWYRDELEVAKKHGIGFHSFNLSPHDIPQYLDLMKILEVLVSAERPVLIHCYKGSDRTGMVSALALAVEQDLPLPELKKQFSYRYGVFPFFRSVGPSFIALYEGWLNKSGTTHSKSNLIHWMTDEFQDNFKNVQFWIDFINNTDLRTDAQRTVILPAGTKRIVLQGWAFDARTLMPLKELYITIGSRISRKVDRVHNMPHVARHFELGDKYYQNFNVGWDVEFSRDDFSSGCHEVSLRIMDRGAGVRDIATGRLICIE